MGLNDSRVAIFDSAFQFISIKIRFVQQKNKMALTQTQIFQLYVSIFGRASEGAGNAYWMVTGGTMALTADLMLDTSAARVYPPIV